MVGVIDKKGWDFLVAFCHKGGIISSTFAIVTPKGLVKSSSDLNSKNIKIISTWARSLFIRMEFVRRMASTTKVAIPSKVRKEI